MRNAHKDNMKSGRRRRGRYGRRPTPVYINYRSTIKAFNPEPESHGDPVQIEPEELEAIRLTDLENLNQEEFLRGISLPLLIIHGDKDTSVPLEWSESAMKYLSDRSKLEVIKGAWHTFDNEGEEVTDLTVNWITKHL